MGKVNIRLEEGGFVTAGHPLNGTIHVEGCIENQSISLSFEGKEKTAVMFKNVATIEKRVFFVDNKHVVKNKDAKSLDFCFDTPDWLPSSLKFPSNQPRSFRSGIRIEYKLMVQIQGETVEEIITVQGALLKPSSQSVSVGPIQLEKRALCCIPSGSVELGAIVENSIVSIGAAVRLKLLECTNADNIQIQLVEKLTWHARKSDIKTQSLILAVLENVNSALHGEVLKVSVPSHCHASYKLELSEISHYICVKAQTNNTLESNPSIQIPLTVGRTSTSQG